MFDGQNAVPANIVNRTQRGHFQSRQRSSKIVIQVEPGKPRAEVSKREKTISQRKNLPIECGQGDQSVRWPFRLVVAGCVSVVHWWR